ncbi:MAG: hypothetical protein ACE5H0_15380 [Bacteroidota bacterium]
MTIDDAARLVLECFTSVDEKQNKVVFKLGSVFELESSEISRYFAQGRHLAALKRIVEGEYLKRLLSDSEMLILAIDEADKCPVSLAQLVRSIATHTQQQGVKGVRFVMAGVSPFFQSMVNEDPGINRFFYKTIILDPMPQDEATDLMETKLGLVAQKAVENGIQVKLHALTGVASL